MKHAFLITSMLFLSLVAAAQRTIHLQNLWAAPEVHVKFGGYFVSFLIKDIDRALVLLSESGNHSFPATSGLDTSRSYYIELYPGTRTEYKDKLQILMQKGVGAFLLTAGHATVYNAKRKKLKSVISDILPVKYDINTAAINFYDPRRHKMLFSGSMPVCLYKADLGIY